MSCETGLPDTDPAALQPALLRRIPAAADNADSFLREAATEFFRKSGVWRDQRTTLVTNTSQTRYTLATPSAGRIVRIAHVWVPGECGHEYKMIQDTEIHSNDDHAQRWHQPNPATIAFHHEFAAPLTVRLETVLTVDDNNVGDASLIEEWRETILNGASYFATMSMDKDSSDRYAKVDFYNLFQNGINEAFGKYQQKLQPERRAMSRTLAIREGRP